MTEQTARRRPPARPPARRRTPPRRPSAAARRRTARRRRAVAWGIALTLALGVVGALGWALVQVSTWPGPVPPPVAATAAPTVEVPDTDAAAATTTASGVDAEWLRTTAEATGIPARALQAYAGAMLRITADQPACGIGWNTLAGIGSVESGHGSHAGSVLGDDGVPSPPIRGIALDGTASAVIRDTDGGRWDGDTEWDRAVGPMQFIPDTWERWGADGNGDGVADPNQIDDAALAAARYLCHSGEMTSADGWRRAIFSYNNLEVYVSDVATMATSYAQRAAG